MRERGEFRVFGNANARALFVERWGPELASRPVRPEPMDVHAMRELIVQGRTDSARA